MPFSPKSLAWPAITSDNSARRTKANFADWFSNVPHRFSWGQSAARCHGGPRSAL